MDLPSHILFYIIKLFIYEYPFFQFVPINQLKYIIKDSFRFI